MMTNRRSPPSTTESPCNPGTKPRTGGFTGAAVAAVSERHESVGQPVPTPTVYPRVRIM